MTLSSPPEVLMEVVAPVPPLPAQPELLQLPSWHEQCLGCLEHRLAQLA